VLQVTSVSPAVEDPTDRLFDTNESFSPILRTLLLDERSRRI